MNLQKSLEMKNKNHTLKYQIKTKKNLWKNLRPEKWCALQDFQLWIWEKWCGFCSRIILNPHFLAVDRFRGSFPGIVVVVISST